MTGKKSKQNIKYLWGLSLKDSIIVTFFGVLIAFSKYVIRMPLSIPGHTGFLWMAVLTICCLIYKEGRAGILAGFIAGIAAVILVPGKEGVLTFFKYFIPGLSMDLLLSLIPYIRGRWYLTSILAAVCHSTKLVVNIASGLILHLPMGFITLGLGVALSYHILFGFLGGLLGYIVYSRIPLNKILLREKKYG